MYSKYRRHIWGAALGAAVAYRLVKGNRRGVLESGGNYLAGIHTPWLAYDPVFKAHWVWMLAAFAGFFLFSLYWEFAARKTADNKNAESTGSRGIHVFLTNLALLLEIVPIVGLGRFLPASQILMSAGLAIEFGGLAIAIWARRHLGLNWSGRIAIKVGHELIRTGPYRRLRHPIYTGILMMYCGIAIVSGEWLALIGFALALVAYWRKIRLEEAALGTAFGEAYKAYRRESWVVVPGVF